MVARLLEAGHDVQVLGRTADRRRELERLGAHAVDGVAAAGAHADVVVLCVFTDEQVRDVCLDTTLLDTMRPGSALVVHTTTRPKTIEAITVRADDVDLVDAPVSGGPHDVAAGRLALFVGAPTTPWHITSLVDDGMQSLRPLFSNIDHKSHR